MGPRAFVNTVTKNAEDRKLNLHSPYSDDAVHTKDESARRLKEI